MCLPLQLSPGDSPYILLFRPDIQNRHMHICKHISSTYAFFPLPLIAEAIQPSPGVSAYLSYPSCLTAYKAAPPTKYPWHSQGTAAILLPTAPSRPSMASEAVHMAGIS